MFRRLLVKYFEMSRLKGNSSQPRDHREWSPKRVRLLSFNYGEDGLSGNLLDVHYILSHILGDKKCVHWGTFYSVTPLGPSVGFTSTSLTEVHYYTIGGLSVSIFCRSDREAEEYTSEDGRGVGLTEIKVRFIRMCSSNFRVVVGTVGRKIEYSDTETLLVVLLWERDKQGLCIQLRGL